MDRREMQAFACSSLPEDLVSLASAGGAQYPYIANFAHGSSSSLPSVFYSPFTNSSVRKFIMAIPTFHGRYNLGASSFSSLSTATLAFLAVSSPSVQSKHLLIDPDQQERFTEKRSMISALASLLRSQEKPLVDRITRIKGTLRIVGKKEKREKKTKWIKDASLHIETDSSSQEMAQSSCAVSPNQGASYVNEEEIDESRRQICSGLEKSGKSDSQKMEGVLKYLVAGAVSTIISRTSVAPLERLKVAYMLGGAKHSWVHVIQGIWITEGLSGFWKGNILNLLRMVPFKSINFLAYDLFCKDILEKQGKSEVTNLDRLTAGAASGAAATLLCFPLDTMRTRLIAPGGEALGGMLGCFNQMIRREGFLSLYKGLFPALLSMVPSGAVFYGVYDILKSHYLQSPEAQTKLQRHIIEARGEKSSSNMDGGSVSHENENVNITVELGPIRTLLYGAIAGACSEVVTYPLEVIRRQLQLQQSTAKIGCVAAFQMIVERDGFGALFSGVTPSTIQVLPSAALSYLVYESMKSILKLS